VVQLTLRQLRRFGLTPDTNLGQHFLTDDNVLRVIERMAELDPQDVCYEPGVGVGVLTDFLARRVHHVHGVELDRRLEPAIDAMQADLDNVTIHWSDATKLDPATLEPTPTKLVSNLPYHVAAPIVAETLQHSPAVRTFCVMIQREVAERFFAAPGSSNYGAISVLVQALTERTGFHSVARTVFAPPPNVDSSLLAFVRRDDPLGPGQTPAFAQFVKESFTQRRKTLANNLSTRVGGREPVVEALAQLGHGPSARPQELAAPHFVELFGRLG